MKLTKWEIQGDASSVAKRSKPKSLVQEIFLLGNNHGDYVKIQQTAEQAEKSCFNLEVGHCCVVVLRSQVPTEFLASLISNFMLTGEGGFSRSTSDKLKDFAVEVMGYGKSFTDERLTHIKEYSFFGDEI